MSARGVDDAARARPDRITRGRTVRTRRHGIGRRARCSPRELLALSGALVAYAAVILPRVRTELRSWEARAATIPDAVLRAHARSTLREKALNAEAAAVFAILAPRASRRAMIALLVAYQVLTDYLDTLSEQPAPDMLANGIQLHRALTDALLPIATTTDYYLHHPRHDDDGYVAELVAFCRSRFHALPSAGAVRAVALGAARRCGEGQSHTHAALRNGPEQLAAWAGREGGSSDYAWWEIAAGASSSVAIHALLAMAADPACSRQDAARVDAAYFPSIGALTVLLDNLVDRDADRASGTHNYLSYYATSGAAAERLAQIHVDAVTTMDALRRHPAHAAILTGVLGFYLSAPEADTPYARPVKQRMVATAGPELTPVLIVMRLRRGHGRSPPSATARRSRAAGRSRRAARRRRS